MVHKPTKGCTLQYITITQHCLNTGQKLNLVDSQVILLCRGQFGRVEVVVFQSGPWLMIPAIPVKHSVKKSSCWTSKRLATKPDWLPVATEPWLPVAPSHGALQFQLHLLLLLWQPNQCFVLLKKLLKVPYMYLLDTSRI